MKVTHLKTAGKDLNVMSKEKIYQKRCEEEIEANDDEEDADKGGRRKI